MGLAQPGRADPRAGPGAVVEPVPGPGDGTAQSEGALRDGDVAFVRCAEPDARYFDESRRVIFVNGMGNDPAEHRASALALSALEQCVVVGIFNATSGTTRDLGQCIADAWQFSRPAPREPAQAFEALCADLAARGDTRSRSEIMRAVLATNPAAGALYDALTDASLAHAPIYAHSQGNLITSNVLRGMEIALGPESIKGRRVYSFGSPCRAWPRGIVRSENSFAFDPVTWMGRPLRLRVSRVVVPTDVPWYWPFAHSLRVYLEHDAEFVVNRRRLGGTNVSVSMDEKGLARDLFEMGRNTPRVDAVLRYLDDEHRGNADDVVRSYVALLRESGVSEPMRSALRGPEGLISRLIRALERGYTSDREDDSIAFLRALSDAP